MDLITSIELQKAHDHLRDTSVTKDYKFLEKTFLTYLDQNVEETKQNSQFRYNCIADLATVYRDLGKYFLAIHFYEMAIELEKGKMESVSCLTQNMGMAYKFLGYRYKGKGYNEKAIELFEESCRLTPNEPTSKVNKSSMFVSSGNPQKAIEILEEEGVIGDEDYDAKWNLGLAKLEIGDYETGFSLYQNGLLSGKRADRTYIGGEIPKWDGSPNKKIILYGEQGIGDEILFAEVIPDILKTNQVILDCHDRLQKIFRESFPEARCYGTRKRDRVEWIKFENPEAYLDVVGAMSLYRKKREDYSGKPYLKANERLVEAYAEKLKGLGPKKKVGISWVGGSLETGRLYRELKLEHWEPLFKYHDQIDFISLQYTQDAQSEIDLMTERSEATLHHWQHTVDDYDHTAALLMNLDLVVTVPQSVVHLAGALGVPCLQICPIQSMWQCGTYGEDAPFYGSVKNFWQKKDSDWEKIMREVAPVICQRLNITQ